VSRRNKHYLAQERDKAGITDRAQDNYEKGGSNQRIRFNSIRKLMERTPIKQYQGYLTRLLKHDLRTYAYDRLTKALEEVKATGNIKNPEDTWFMFKVEANRLNGDLKLK